MKKLFTLLVVACFSYTAANAQDKKADQATKLDSKESLMKAQPQVKKIDAAELNRKRANVVRIDATNSKGTILTEEQVKTRAKTNQSTKKREEK